jgi:hypothetical protein
MQLWWKRALPFSSLFYPRLVMTIVIGAPLSLTRLYIPPHALQN